MRRLVIALVLVGWSVTPALAQVSVAQAPSLSVGPYTAGVKTFTGLTSLSTGQLVICGAAILSSRTFSSITVGGEAMTLIATINTGFGGQTIAYRVITGDESGQDVVVTLSGADAENTPVGCIVVAGAATDQSGQDTDSNVPAGAQEHTIGPVTPTTASNIVVGWSGDRGNRSWTNASGWTVVGEANRYAMVYDIQDAADDRSWTFSTTDSAGGAWLSLAVFAAAGGDPQRRLMLLGVGQ